MESGQIIWGKGGIPYACWSLGTWQGGVRSWQMPLASNFLACFLSPLEEAQLNSRLVLDLYVVLLTCSLVDTYCSFNGDGQGCGRDTYPFPYKWPITFFFNQEQAYLSLCHIEVELDFTQSRIWPASPWGVVYSVISSFSVYSGEGRKRSHVGRQAVETDDGPLLCKEPFVFSRKGKETQAEVFL